MHQQVGVFALVLSALCGAAVFVLLRQRVLEWNSIGALYRRLCTPRPNLGTHDASTHGLENMLPPEPVTPVVAAAELAPVPVPAPVTEPVTASVTAGDTVPVTAPVSTPITAPVTTPVTAPVTTPVTAPVTAAVTAPVTAPVTAAVTAPVTAAVTVPVTAPVKAPVTAPVKAPVTAPVTVPVTAPVLVDVATVTPVSGPFSAVESAAFESGTLTPNRLEFDDSLGSRFAGSEAERESLLARRKEALQAAARRRYLERLAAPATSSPAAPAPRAPPPC